VLISAVLKHGYEVKNELVVGVAFHHSFKLLNFGGLGDERGGSLVYGFLLFGSFFHVFSEVLTILILVEILHYCQIVL
jgi:hypothetical protein